MIGNIDKMKCTGCKMCADLCPTGAISFAEDEKGFWYPSINEEKCTNCGLCKSKCPALNQDKISKGEEPVVYAAWSKDSSLRRQSTSGGIFFEIAKKMINRGGVVVACRYSDDFKSAYHYLAHSLEELKLLCGSKYFQSDTAGIYKKVKEELNMGKEVLFCGTPCQIAGMQMYLGKPQSRIIYLDFICRSINSPLAYKKYIEELEEQYESKVKKVHMKNKKTGWQSLALQVQFESGQESHRDKNEDWWMKGFLKHDLFTRNSCYSCDYRSLPRKFADITVGDFWGIYGESESDMFQGISVVMLNSQKGISLFEEIKNNLCYKKKSIEEVLPGNPALKRDPKKSDKGNVFFEELKKSTFSEAVMRSSGEKELKNKKRNVLHIISDYRKDVKRYARNGRISFKDYVYYNYFCKGVESKEGAKIIPYMNSVIELHPSAKIVLYEKKDLEIGTEKLDKSFAETYIRLGENAMWHVRRGGKVGYLSSITLNNGAVLDTGYFTLNVGNVITVDKKIVFGDDVMTARNVVVYDSDFHQLQDDCGVQINPSQEVYIGNHVWLGVNCMVLKGVNIGQDSMVAAGAVVTQNMPERAMVVGIPAKCLHTNLNWKRENKAGYEEIYRTKKLILFGYGIVGRGFAAKYGENIVQIIDNHPANNRIMTFKEFQNKNPELDREYVWVIASPNYYDEIYNQIKKKYPDMMIVSAR